MRDSARRLSAAQGLLLAVGLADVVLLTACHWTIATRGLAVLAIGCSILLVVHQVYRRWRPEPKLAALAGTALQFALATALLGTLSYLLTSLSATRPLVDTALAAFDQAVGLDWRAYQRLAYATPALRALTQFGYALLGMELLGLILTLDLIGRAERAQELLLGFCATALAAILIAAVWPAAGAYVHYATVEQRSEPYVLQYLAARSTAPQALDLLRMQGIVQFPSFHAALALLCSFVVRGTRLWWPLLAVNAWVVLATPPAGGHHFVDVLAGLALAAAVALTLRRAASRVTA